jgi:O-antigen/teichoic acid export membrane protein
MAHGPRLGRAMRWDFAGALITAFVGVAGSVAFVRVVGVHAYGAYLLVLNAIGLPALVFGLGYEQIIGRFVPEMRMAGDAAGIRALLRRLATTRALCWLVIALAFLLGGGTIARALGHENLASAFRAASVAAFGALFQDFAASLLVVAFRQRRLALIRTVTAVATPVASISAAQASGGGVAWAVAATGLVTAGAVVAMLLAARGLGQDEEGASIEARATPPRARRSLLRYGLAVHVYAVANFALARNVDLILIGALSSNLGDVAAYSIGYGIANQALTLPIMFIGGGVLIPTLTERWRDGGPEAVRVTVESIIRFVYVIALPIGAIGAVLSHRLLGVLYNAHGSAVTVAVIFFAVTALQRLGGLPATILSVTDREQWFFLSRGGGALLNVGLDVLMIPAWGATGAAVATVIAGTVTLAVEASVARDLGTLKVPWDALGRALLAALAAGGAAALLDRLFPADGAAAAIVAGSIGGGLVYVALLRVLRPLTAPDAERLGRLSFPFARHAHLFARPPS